MGFGLYMINELKINGQTVDDNDDFNIENDTQKSRMTILMISLRMQQTMLLKINRML